MRVFNDYDFLAKYVRQDAELSVHHRLALELVSQLDVRTVLDIGGGTNSYLGSLGEAYDTAVVDLSEASLENVKAKRKIIGALPRLPILDGFDFVSALEVLEHLEAPIYEDSLREIARLSNKFVFITSPFLQDLSAAYVLCDKCQTVFQCEGHCRSFDFKTIGSLQEYFGGVAELFFIGKPVGNYFLYAKAIWLKRIIRRILQQVLRKKYCYPPFTKCPECGNEMFNNYEEYLKKKRSLERVIYWKWRETRAVSDRFGALFDKKASKVRL